MLYPETPRLSVEGDQVRSMSVEDRVVAARLVGGVGGVVSGEEAIENEMRKSSVLALSAWSWHLM